MYSVTNHCIWYMSRNYVSCMVARESWSGVLSRVHWAWLPDVCLTLARVFWYPYVALNLKAFVCRDSYTHKRVKMMHPVIGLSLKYVSLWPQSLSQLLYYAKSTEQSMLCFIHSPYLTFHILCLFSPYHSTSNWVGSDLLCCYHSHTHTHTEQIQFPKSLLQYIAISCSRYNLPLCCNVVSSH